MESPRKYADRELRWLQPKAFTRVYELRADETVLATMRLEGFFEREAVTEVGRESWSFTRRGAFDTGIAIEQTTGGALNGEFHYDFWGNGELTLSNGTHLKWESLGFWRSKWRFTDTEGTAVLTLREGVRGGGFRDIFKEQGTIEIPQAARERPELVLLVCLGWFLVLLQRRRGAAVAAAT